MELLHSLKEGGFIDRKTAVLLVEFNLYNPALDIVVRCEISLEILVGGFYKTHTDMLPFRASPYANWYDAFHHLYNIQCSEICTLRIENVHTEA